MSEVFFFSFTGSIFQSAYPWGKKQKENNKKREICQPVVLCLLCVDLHKSNKSTVFLVLVSVGNNTDLGGEREDFRQISCYSCNTNLLCTTVVVFLLAVSRCLHFKAGWACGANFNFTVFSETCLQVKGYFTFSPIWMCFHNLPLLSIYQDVMEQVEPWLKRFLSLGSSSERAEWDGRVGLIYAKPATALIFSGQRGATDCHCFKMKRAFNKSLTYVRDFSFQTWPPSPSPGYLFKPGEFVQAFIIFGANA